MSQFNKGTNESFTDYHIRIYSHLKEYGLTSEHAAELLNKESGYNYSESKWRKDYAQYVRWKEYLASGQDIEASDYSYKETTEILSDGTLKSDKLVSMSVEQSKDVNYLLEAHGFDPTKWELTSAKNNIWNVSNKNGANKVLYSSKISVKPKTLVFDIDSILKLASKTILPVNIKKKNGYGERMLEIPFVDMHFGINDFKHYEETLNNTIELIQSKLWDTIYIPIGNDLLHNNDFKGRTANGTPIEKVDMQKAWADAFNFYCFIYEAALENANHVVSDYVCGNHDTEMTWAFTKMLEVKYPQITWNTSPENKKIFVWNDVVILSLHGDKGLSRVVDGLITKYRKYITNAKVVEIHSGHKHSEKVIDKYGILVRTLPTSSQEDSWHVEESFEGSVKATQIFEYISDKLKHIHYV